MVNIIEFPSCVLLRIFYTVGLRMRTAGSGQPITTAPQLLSAANHLEIPMNNPNLLSPDILNQRRGTNRQSN